MIRNVEKAALAALTVVVVLYPAIAHADTGIPMLAVSLPAFVIMLIPVIWVEAMIFKHAGFDYDWALKWSGIANIVTTVIGVPMTWGVLTTLELIATDGGHCPSLDTLSEKIRGVLISAPWLCPDEERQWLVPAAYLVLLVPFFLVSWKVESFIIRRGNRHLDPLSIDRTCLRANLVSYVLMALFPLSWYL